MRCRAILEVCPLKTAYHNSVRHALEADGWTITDDPLPLRVGTRDLYIDLGAERLLAAERGSEKIAVEIKTFGGVSPIASLEQALGQFVLYSDALELLCLGLTKLEEGSANFSDISLVKCYSDVNVFGVPDMAIQGNCVITNKQVPNVMVLQQPQ
jgi:hypothetical protein